METALILSQTFFYFVFSIMLIITGVFFSIATYHLVSIAKELEAISRDFRNLTDETQEGIRHIIERLSKLPILSFLLKRQKSRGVETKKGGGKK